MSHDDVRAATSESGPAGYGIAPAGFRLPAKTRLGPVRLQVSDLARSEDFYRRALGMEPLWEGTGTVTLGVIGDAKPLVKLLEKRGVAPLAPWSRIGLYHYALRLPHRTGLGRLAVHLHDLGIGIGMADHLVSEALYLSDPDGLGIEVYVDRPRSQWQVSRGQLVMTTEPLGLGDLVGQAHEESYRHMPLGTVMGHVHLHVGGLDEAARFYHEAIGFDKTVWDYQGALFVSAGGYHHHIGMNTWAAHARPAGADDARLLSWSLIVPTTADVGSLTKSVEAAGWSVEKRDGGWHVDDPWGTTVEVLA